MDGKVFELMHDFKEIEKIKDELVGLMLKRFPKCRYTVEIILWDDKTFRVRCKYGEPIGEPVDGVRTAMLNTYEWYEGEIRFNDELIQQPLGS